MRRQRLGPLIPIVAGVVLFGGFVIGVATALGAGMVLAAGFALVAHLWFVTWGPSAEPNRFHRRELWENKRRVHEQLRRRRG